MRFTCSVYHKWCITCVDAARVEAFSTFNYLQTSLHWWKVNEWAKLWLALCKNCLVEPLWKHSLGEVKLRKTQQPYEIEIDHLIDFFLFLGPMLDCCTSLLLNIKPATLKLQIWAAGPPQVKMRNFALFEKIKAGWRVRQGCCKTRKQLPAYYGFQHKRLKSNNIYPKCQIAVMLFVML